MALGQLGQLEFHMIKDRIKFCDYVYQCPGLFFQFYCICILQKHILSCSCAKFVVPGVFCVLVLFAFSVFLSAANGARA